MSPQCNLCRSQDCREQMPIQGHRLVKCNGCGLSFLDPIPTTEHLKRMYTADYYTSADSNKAGYSNYKQDADLIVLTAIRRYQMMISKIKPAGKIKLLDVGCAYGYYLDVARLYGWDVTGVDFSEDAVKEAVERLKLNIKQGTLADQALPSGHFDIVSAWDLIEHVQDPQSLFAEMNRVLKVGGSLVLATPDIGSLPSKIMGRRWMGFKSSEHIYFFSKDTLCQYLEKNGFEVKEHAYAGKYISRTLFLNRLNYYFGPLSVVIGAFKAFLPAYFYLNSFDIIYLRAEKKA